MVPRVFYIALGAAAGVVAVRRAARAAQALSPDSVLGSVSAGVRGFADDVRDGMAEREAELRDALGLDGRHDEDTVSDPSGSDPSAADDLADDRVG